MARVAHELGEDGYWNPWQGTYSNPVVERSYDNSDDALKGVNATLYYSYRDDLGNYWQERYYPDGSYELWTAGSKSGPGPYPSPADELRKAEEGEEPKGFISQAQEKPPDPIPITEDEVRDTLDEPGEFGRVVLGQPTRIADPDPKPSDPGPPYVNVPPNHDMSSTKLGDIPEPKVFVPPGDEAEEEARRDHALDPYRGDQQRAEELERYEQAQNPDLAKQRAEEWARYEEATNPDLAKQRAEELERYEQAQGGARNPLAGGGEEGAIPGLGVPYRDFIPFAPMVKDPTTGQWRNAEPGEIPGAEEGEADQTPPAGDTEDPGSQAQEVSPLQFGNTGNFQNAPDPNAPPDPSPPDNEEYQSQEVPPLQFGNTGNFQNAPAVPPVAEQQPAPAPPPYDPATGITQPDGNGDGIPNEYGVGPDLDGNGVPDEIGINPDNQQPGYPGGEGLPDGNANGIPGEYGDGPDLDANGIPDEIGINPDGLQPGYPNPSASGDWGGVGVPDPTVVPQSDATTGAEAMPEEYGDGSTLGGDWAPDEAAIDPYALQQPAYEEPSSSSSTSGDGAWDPYGGGSSDPYGSAPPEEALPEEPSVPEGSDPSASGSF